MHAWRVLRASEVRDTRDARRVARVLSRVIHPPHLSTAFLRFPGGRQKITSLMQANSLSLLLLFQGLFTYRELLIYFCCLASFFKFIIQKADRLTVDKTECRA